jgi:hypothetical protein
MSEEEAQLMKAVIQVSSLLCRIYGIIATMPCVPERPDRRDCVPVVCISSVGVGKLFALFFQLTLKIALNYH